MKAEQEEAECIYSSPPAHFLFACEYLLLCLVSSISATVCCSTTTQALHIHFRLAGCSQLLTAAQSSCGFPLFYLLSVGNLAHFPCSVASPEEVQQPFPLENTLFNQGLAKLSMCITGTSYCVYKDSASRCSHVLLFVLHFSFLV